MSLLDRTFEELLHRIKSTDYLNPAASDPIYYFVYPPEDMLELKRHFTRWIARFGQEDLKVLRVSLGDLLWECVDESGRWDDWLEAEEHYDIDQLNHALSDVLTANNRLIEKILAKIESTSAGMVLFLTETELLHPYFRTRNIESFLHDKIKIPVVIFYPGRRSGQYGLKFLGFYPEDPNYRSTMIGGV